jgi:hypothetical protein
MIHNSGRLYAGALIGRPWENAAATDTDLSGFWGALVFPLNCNVLPQHSILNFCGRCWSQNETINRQEI